MSPMRPAVDADNPLLAQFRDNPYPLYQHLLATAPVRFNEELGAYTLVRYADVAQILSSPDVSVERELDAVGGGGPVGSMVVRSMLVSDPPDHTRLRNLVSKAFTPRMVEQLRPRIEAIVAEQLEQLRAQGGEVDLIASLAYPLPVIVIAELLGVPPADRDTFHAWSGAVAASLDPLVSEERLARAAAARQELHAYLRGIIAQRRREPRSDLISALVAVEERGDVLSEPELVIMCTLLLIAGHETTVNLIGNGMLALLRHPDQMQRLVEQPELIGTAVEELLRYDSPVQLTARIITQETEIGGVRLLSGDWVLPLLGGANHDPAQFAEPDRLDITRSPNPHLAFGRGIHFCLGAPLARLEGQIAIGGLVRHFPAMQLAATPTRRNQITLRGLSSLPVRLTP